MINKFSTIDLDFRKDLFLRNLLEIAVLVELRRLKHKTRIPVENGYHLHGLMDETECWQKDKSFASCFRKGSQLSLPERT